MTDSPIDASLARTAQTLADFAAGPVTDAGKTIEAAVERSFSAVERTIARAAVNGKLSIDNLVNAILADFDRIALSEFVTKPLTNVIGQVAGSLLGGIFGTRAQGGPVLGGVPYLVGEQGPEMFVPQSTGAIVPNTALQQRPQITLNVTARDAQSFLKSETQIAAMLSRALARGQRNL
jgi:phage-related minor tail protein